MKLSAQGLARLELPAISRTRENLMSPEHNTEHLAFRVTPSLKKACADAAQRVGLTLPDWFRLVVSQAAHQNALGPPKKRKR